MRRPRGFTQPSEHFTSSVGPGQDWQRLEETGYSKWRWNNALEKETAPSTMSQSSWAPEFRSRMSVAAFCAFCPWHSPSARWL